MNHRGTEHTKVAQRRACLPTFVQSPLVRNIRLLRSSIIPSTSAFFGLFESGIIESRKRNSTSFSNSLRSPKLIRLTRQERWSFSAFKANSSVVPWLAHPLTWNPLSCHDSKYRKENRRIYNVEQ